MIANVLDTPMFRESTEACVGITPSNFRQRCLCRGKKKRVRVGVGG